MAAWNILAGIFVLCISVFQLRCVAQTLPPEFVATKTQQMSMPDPGHQSPTLTFEGQNIMVTPEDISNKFIVQPKLTQILKAPNDASAEFVNIPVPILPPIYEVTLEVSDMLSQDQFKVLEKERAGRARHTLEAGILNVTCIFNSHTAEGFLVEGVKCGRFSDLPQKCFCVTKFCRPYVAVGAILRYLKKNNANVTKQKLDGTSDIDLYIWRVSRPDMTIEAIYSHVKKYPQDKMDQLTPVSFTVKGSGRDFLFSVGEVWLQYMVVGWSLETDSSVALDSTPPGVYCPVYEKKFLPKLSNQFSLTMETVIENLATIAYERQHYDAEEKLVSFTYRPHLHGEGIFLQNIPGFTDSSRGSYRVVHDFKTGIQYMIDEKTSNCSIQGIPVSALDVEPTDSQHIRLRHASALISIDPKMYFYKGMRSVRGVLCDVWVAEREVTKGRYSTVEVFFSHENWTVEIFDFNKVRQIPIGISTYTTDVDAPRKWTSIVHTFFYEYTDEHPSWDEFDIAPCLSRINRVFILLTLEVSYTELVHYNMESIKNSIRKAVADMAGVSPLRVTDLSLSSRPVTGQVDVRFVLLEKTQITGPILSPPPQLLMADAYKLLHDITDKHNVSVKVDLSPTKKLFVTIKPGSVETNSDALQNILVTPEDKSNKSIVQPKLTQILKAPNDASAEVVNIPVPILPPIYEVTLEVSDMLSQDQFKVLEKEQAGRARHTLEAGILNVTCIFNSHTAEGYLVEGVKCGRFSGLPQKCFCVTKFCRPYVAVGALLQYLKKNNAKVTKHKLGGTSDIDLYIWRVSRPDMTIEAIYSHVKKYPQDKMDQLTPVSFTVKGSGRVFLLPGGEVWLQYKVVGWSLETDSSAALDSTPPGVYCPVYEKKFLPKLSNQFSLTMETVIENLATIAYERQHYEAEEKLVSFTYRPHLHAEGIFLLNIPGLTDLSLESYRVVHDFKTGIQYMINEKTCNCSIQGIPVSALDAAPTDSQHIRLRHASELISIDPKMFFYKGMRSVRGVLCDVWVAERGVTKGRYSTVEVFFSHENWTVEIEVFNKVRQVPIGISTYITDVDAPRKWTSIVHTFFYEYTDGHPSWDEFDIAPCLSRINRVFLLLTLEVSYTELVHYNLELVKNSIRRAVAGIAGVSPLRVTDLFLSSRPATGQVDVWFVLLEKPQITGPILSPRPQLFMADAYKLLHDITHKHNVSVKVDLSPTKKLFVTIKPGSLETSSDALHPKHRNKSMRFLKAGYTAGSMAGLGFSMAVLGTCVGVFVGFLLWKRSYTVPYKITD